MVRIERVGPADWERLRDVRLRMLRDTPIAFQETYEQALALEESDWRFRAAQAAWPGRVGVVAVGPEGEWAGHMGACRVAPGQVLLITVWVAPEHRGRSAGVADRLLDAVLGWAGEDAAAQTAGSEPEPPRILLEVHESNARAIAFYGRRGFCPTGRSVPYPLDRSTVEIEMARPL